MSAAKRHGIMTALATRLATIPGAAVEVMPAGDPDVLPALGLIDQGQRVVERTPFATRWAMDVLCDGYTDGDGGAAALSRLNDLYLAVVREVMAEPTLGGLAVLVMEQDMTIETFELAERRALRFMLRLEVEYMAATVDPVI